MPIRSKCYGRNTHSSKILPSMSETISKWWPGVQNNILLQLLSPRAATIGAHMPTTCALQQEKSLQSEACTSQGRCCCEVSSVVSDSVRAHRRQPTRLPLPGILQARTLEWVAISFSNACKSKVKVKSLSRVWLLGTPWTAAHQAPPFMGFSRQEYRSGLPLPSPSQGRVAY